MPKISVVIAAYNCAEFLEEAVASVLAQTYKDLEIIVVDDGSTDNTEELMKKHLGKVIYIRQENGGPSKARNTGIYHAKGEFVAFLDADDIWLPHKIEEQLNVLEANPAAAFTHSRAVTFESGTGRQLQIVPARVYSGYIFNRLLTETAPIILSSVIARTPILKNTGGFDEGFFMGEDIDLWLRIAKHHEIVGIDKVLVQRRVHGKNISCLKDRPNDIVDVLDKIVTMFPETAPGGYPPMKKGYLIRGKELAGSLFYRSEYSKCHSACKRLLGISFWEPGILFYWLITFLPLRLLDLLRQMRRKFIYRGHS